MCFLARRAGGEPAVILGMVETGVFQVAFHLGEEVARVCELMQRYRDVPMSLADACLVRMAECFSDGVILMLDSDFTIYRKHGKQPISVGMPNFS